MSRGKLRCGEQILHLWEESEIPFNDDKMRRCSETSYRFGPILVGPATNNPTPTAIKVVMTLPDLKAFHLSTGKDRHAFM